MSDLKDWVDGIAQELSELGAVHVGGIKLICDHCEMEFDPEYLDDPYEQLVRVVIEIQTGRRQDDSVIKVGPHECPVCGEDWTGEAGLTAVVDVDVQVTPPPQFVEFSFSLEDEDGDYP